MKRIAFFLILAYGLLFVALTLPLTFVMFYDLPPNAHTIFYGWEYWTFLALLLSCEMGLLFIPVQIERRKKISRKTILLPILLSGFLAASLFFGLVLSLYEFFEQELALQSQWIAGTALVLAVLVWGGWTIVFAKISGQNDTKNAFLKQCNTLIKVSFISLLIAVPTHIIARHRDYCCAGLFTFIGITFGLSVMLLSFGPGIYFLYAQRWKKLHPDSLKETSETSQDSHASF